jgi:hypothetical protein
MKLFRCLFLELITLVLLVACGTPSNSTVYVPGGTPDPALMAQITLVYAHATDTQVAAIQTQQAYDAAIQTQAQAQTQIASYTQAAQTQQAMVTASNMTAWAGVTSTALAATQQVEHNAVTAKLVTVWGMIAVLFLACLLILAWFGVKIYQIYIDARAQKIQSERVEPDMHGRYPAVNSKNLQGGKLIMPNLAHRATIDPEQDDLTTEQALANKAMNNDLEATRALAGSSAFGRQMARNLAAPAEDVVDPGLTITKQELPLLPGAPSWSMIESWDGKGGIPYGVSGNGLELLDLNQVPHGGVFGKTGKGKSRYFLRPFIAAAIAAGNRVVIMGKQADFRVFAEHPNVTMLPVQQFTNPEEAGRYADFLKRIVEEMNRRDNFLVSRGASTWQQSGRYPTLLILDELGNALAMMPPDIQKQAYRWIQGLVQEGRKAGFNVWMASQRAVGFKSIVEQLGRAVFHLADAEASRYALGFTGAEELEDGQFFAKFNRIKKCLAFDPSDEDIRHLFAGRQVKVHEPIDWIEGIVTDAAPTVTTETASAAPADNTDSRILAMYEDMLSRDKVSLSAIQRSVYGRQIPTDFYHIQELVKEYQAKRRTTTTTGNMPESGTMAA